MNQPTLSDDELATAVRGSVTSVRMTIPAEQIVSRGRTIRARRRVPFVTGALAGVAGAAALGVTALTSGQQSGQPVTAQLAAWTVTTQANGDIRVIIRDVRDRGGLQRTLRADGLSVRVSSTSPSLNKVNVADPPQPLGCQNYPATESQLDSVVQTYPGGKTTFEFKPNLESVALVIRPSALPDGTGLSIVDLPETRGSVPMALGLVQASQQCTGN